MFSQTFGFGLGTTSPVSAVKENGIKQVIVPEMINGSVDFKILPFLGLDAILQYDVAAKTYTLFTYEGGVKVYLPLWFVQPTLALNVGQVILSADGVNNSNMVWDARIGVDVGLLKHITLGAELGYYENDIPTMINTFKTTSMKDVLDQSWLSVGIKIWL